MVSVNTYHFEPLRVHDPNPEANKAENQTNCNN
jgi:hypothetical protein